MSIKILSKFAFKNIRANKILVLPFLISTTLMVTLLNIILNLSQIPRIVNTHILLATMLSLGSLITCLFTFIFIFYANRFLVKRRNKEFALYEILGLEKKHTAGILLIEQIIYTFIILLFSIVSGYILGKVIFLLLNNILHEVTPTLIEYSLSGKALIYTVSFTGISMLAVYIFNVLNIGKLTPIQLLSSQKKAEKEPKSKAVITIAGAICLIYGYYIALTTKGTSLSSVMFFKAAFFVIIGTYLLFISLSILILKKMKKNKNFFYKPKHFLSVSGMLYRMKANAVGLASIALLSTTIIVTVTSTLTAYLGLESSINDLVRFDYQYSISSESFKKMDEKTIKTEKETLAKKITEASNGNVKADNIKMYEDIFFPVSKNGEKIEKLKKMDGNGMAVYVSISYLDDFNNENSTKYTLGDNEILMTSNYKSLRKENSLYIAGNKYNIKKIDYNLPSNIVVETYKFVVKDRKQMYDIFRYYDINNSNQPMTVPGIVAKWNYKNAPSSYPERLKKMYRNTEYSSSLDTKEEVKKSVYEMYGGMLFLGTVVGLVFLIGTILITYYKQVSEAIEDRDSYQIMKKVGLPDELIRKSTKTQILWMFFLPLGVSIIHTVFASKILYQLLGIFGVRDISMFFKNFGLIIAIFSVLYLVVFTITSKIYYKIVS